MRSAKVNNVTRGAADEVPGRVSQACRACAANHVRCTESKPCRRCAEKGLECVFSRSEDDLTALDAQPNHLLPSPSTMPSSLDVHMEEPMFLNASDQQEVPPSHASLQSPLQPSSPAYQNAHSRTTNVVSSIHPVQQSNFGMPTHSAVLTHSLYSWRRWI